MQTIFPESEKFLISLFTCLHYYCDRLDVGIKLRKYTFINSLLLAFFYVYLGSVEDFLNYISTKISLNWPKKIYIFFLITTIIYSFGNYEI